MTSSEYRNTFLEFFKERGHEIVPSAPLLPSAPNLLFTNAGMNQFVPYFLGERTAPWSRVADTQKCIRAGGKHNDLEDVGFDTYHHTFFEMLGNWSFGDYFKEEALTWSWELLTRVWNIPGERLYVTVYKPGKGDPAEPDTEALRIWEEILKKDGLDPQKHILFGGKADNFWMMGETGPCGPCSEIHLDCTERGDTAGALVNRDSAWCMEIWNNVFIQFNATPDGRYSPLKEPHVDTGLGLERIAGIAAGTRDFTEFGRLPSNYNCDLFTDLFEELTAQTGHRYEATIPEEEQKNPDPVIRGDCAYRILADHLRCLSCAIADGILPGNEGRNYVIRRILRRAVLWAGRIELKKGALETLVPVVVASLGEVFPELRQQERVIRKVIASEEHAFNNTLDRGIRLLEKIFEQYPEEIPGEEAFVLYDTYGFPLDLTQLMAREKGRSVDEAGFQRAMGKQRERARAAQKTETIALHDDADTEQATPFHGYDRRNLQGFETRCIDVVHHENKDYLVFAESPFYAEMGGQVGDTGRAEMDSTSFGITNTIKDGSGRILHQVESLDTPSSLRGKKIRLHVDVDRRLAIQRNHTATHLLNWALRKILGNHILQAGSLVAPDHLRFDFNHFEPISEDKLLEIEKCVNDAILHNDPVNGYEINIEEKPDDVVAAFGEKYGDRVRVVDIGAGLSLSKQQDLLERIRPGYSAELCGGTHVGATGEIGPFKILSESSISAGTRRIEALAGQAALERFRRDHQGILKIAGLLSCPPDEVENRIQSLLREKRKLDEALRSTRQKNIAEQAGELSRGAHSHQGLNWVVEPVRVSSPKELQDLAVQISKKIHPGVAILGAPFENKCTLVALASREAINRGIRAGDLVQSLTAELDGKGGGKPDFAMGGGKNPDALVEVLKKFRNHIE